jgi:hypothetical protein
MVAELKNYQSQVHAYGFEIERIEDNIKRCKQTYFHMAKQNTLGVV